ncbi:OmpH family outer membrane protein [Parvibaculum sp.]|jgi:Skp family chaperone for outer membrane proteins|uniref:OmpH family outer membrane protein n=1 Tax=Parvibaculum sp. TaxID=2024848 RepID=UPI001B2E8B7C|nr:OmpH family outer membrane protein [Parvibaculum sp.]MBO6667562.1 OmpH family outer membrane protein [Parvibaculum sp.]MBO6692124.1 OmpH family outer membrane protein [Parvibaculum sp.]MBO6714114.1 OmpH family outer membrane protein [Parvibaculum sp.]|tara:strand:+ start:13696 stop:14292 length:597 start_codon:yes stop_codon:yes gene_type:complete
MKYKLSCKRIAVAAAFAFAAYLPLTLTPAMAVGPAVVLIVDTEAVFSQSKVGQSIRSQFEDQAKKLRAEGKKTDDALQADAKKLTEERALLSQEDLKKKVEALQKREAEFRQSMQQKSQALQLGLQRANAKVEAALRPIFAQVLKEKGGTVLFDQSVVLAGGADLDISAEVLKRLNEQMATVEVKPVSLEELQAEAAQ